MKKFILLIISALPMMACAQFTLKPNGFVSSVDTTKNYIVIEASGVSQDDLYKKTLVYLTGLYVSPKEVISTVDKESISVNAVAQKAIKMKVLYLNPSWDINYTIVFQFRDGKIRISQPSVNKMSTYTGDVYRTANIYGGDGPNHKEVYNRKGELKQKEAKEGLENYFNTYIASAVKGITSAKQDNW